MLKKLKFYFRILIHKIYFFKQYKKIQSHYRIVEKNIRNKSTKKLRFASYVVFDSTFSAYELMRLLLEKPDVFSAKIVIIPDISRGEKHLKEQYNNTKNFFIKKYGKDCVIDGFNENTSEFLDVSEQFDLIYMANPYDTMVNPIHSVKYLSSKNILPFYISYCCMPDYYSCTEIMARPELSYFWKVYADNKITLKDYRKYELCSAKNVFCFGYAKMDSLAFVKSENYTKKRIIIAPHHTISYKALPLSNFLEYKDFVFELAKKFPQIDFIFRPHPLLFTAMINEGFWTEQDVIDYKNKLRENNIKYSYGGDYLELFKNSNAIIHDCSSFIVEYLYTDKPCCFVAKENYREIFSKLGKKCLNNYYFAFNKEQIIQFIRNVVLLEQDIMKSKRRYFVNKYLKMNFPHTSVNILAHILNSLNS